MIANVHVRFKIHCYPGSSYLLALSFGTLCLCIYFCNSEYPIVNTQLLLSYYKDNLCNRLLCNGIYSEFITFSQPLAQMSSGKFNRKQKICNKYIYNSIYLKISKIFQLAFFSFIFKVCYLISLIR